MNLSLTSPAEDSVGALWPFSPTSVCINFHFPHGVIANGLAPLWVGSALDAVRHHSAVFLTLAVASVLAECGAGTRGRTAGVLRWSEGGSRGVSCRPALLRFAVLGVVWSVAFPTLIWISDRLDLVAAVGGRYDWRFLEQEGTVLNFTMKSLPARRSTSRKYKGKVVMVVNVASKCGLTPAIQRTPSLHEKYGKDGLVILGARAISSAARSQGRRRDPEFCTTNYGVKFDMFEKVDVNGESMRPLQAPHRPRHQAQGRGKISWNFEKFLIGRNGQVLARFASAHHSRRPGGLEGRRDRTGEAPRFWWPRPDDSHPGSRLGASPTTPSGASHLHDLLVRCVGQQQGQPHFPPKSERT